MVKDPVLAWLEGGSQRNQEGHRDFMDSLRKDPALVAGLVAHLNGADPRVRGGAAGLLADLAADNPLLLASRVPEIVPALEQEELPTRVGAITAIALVAEKSPDAVEEDFDLIRLGLFDPVNPEIRAQAARAVAAFGARDASSARRAFPHLAEALRRFHDRERPGDLVRSLARLAETSSDESLRKDIWRTVRRYEKHEDPAVGAAIGEIAGLARDQGKQEQGIKGGSS